MKPDQAESDEIRSKRLVSAICHEIANHIAAIRLQAHLLNEALKPRDLANASLIIEDLSARSSALLALVRPVLWKPEEPPGTVAADAIAQGIRSTLDEHGGRGVRFEIEIEEKLPEVHGDSGVIHFLLQLHSYGALEAASAGDRVRIIAEARDDAVAFVIEESAAGAAVLLGWPDAGLHGRTLACAIADHILQHSGGRLRIIPDGTRIRTEIVVPRAASARSS